MLLEAVVCAQFKGGGSLPSPERDCLSSAERQRIDQVLSGHQAALGFQAASDTAEPKPYAFFPQGGTLWRDLFVNNFVDLDPTAGIRDWDCTDYTYDGHHGHDVDLRSFGEQAVGVPIFAVLDGTVVDRHDGEFDMQTSFNNSTANYVILHHGGTHYTWYWHMKNGSVAVALNQQVKAGTQLGLTASSGNSTGPHLHFESRFAGSHYEPSAGPCRSGTSGWVNQSSVRRDMFLRDFNITDVLIENYSGLPFDMPRTGTFLSGTRGVSFWINLMNMRANTTWRIRYLRPDNSVALDTGTGAFNNPFYRWSWWWWRYNVNLNVTGTWNIELILNGQSITRAPFTVVSSATQIVNRPPNPISAAFDPPNPRTNDVVFCRINTSLTHDDPDYDIVRYRYRWRINGVTVRDTITAGHADAIPSGLLGVGDMLSCSVVPMDASVSGPAIALQIEVTSVPQFTRQPASVTLSLGRSTQIDAALSGGGTLGYQWRLNGTNLPNATNASLILSNVQVANVGWYSLVAGNVQGSVTSAPAVITALSLGIDASRRAALSVYGPSGASYEADYRLTLDPISPWLSFSNFVLSGNPHVLLDGAAVSQPAKFYRVVPK